MHKHLKHQQPDKSFLSLGFGLHRKHEHNTHPQDNKATLNQFLVLSSLQILYQISYREKFCRLRSHWGCIRTDQSTTTKKRKEKTLFSPYHSRFFFFLQRQLRELGIQTLQIPLDQFAIVSRGRNGSDRTSTTSRILQAIDVTFMLRL